MVRLWCEAAAALSVPDEPLGKAGADGKLIGQSVHDVDLGKILTGTQTYSIDLKLPNMLYAVVRRSPYSDGQPISFDSSEAEKVKGVVGFELLRNDLHGGRVVLPNSPNFVSGVAVLADNTWSAIKGARLLQVDWQKPVPLPDSDRLVAEFERAMELDGEIIRNDGDVGNAVESPSASIDSSYRLPFLAHVPMEPMNCTVDAGGDRITVWAPTQNPEFLAETVSAALQVEQASITVYVVRDRCGQRRGVAGRTFRG